MLMFDESVLNSRPDLDGACGTVVEMTRLPNVGELVEVCAYDSIDSSVEMFTVIKVIHWVLLKGEFAEEKPKAEIILKPGGTR